MSNSEKITYLDAAGNCIGNDFLRPIPWFVGVPVLFEDKQYTVAKIEYVFGHTETRFEGLTITLKTI